MGKAIENIVPPSCRPAGTEEKVLAHILRTHPEPYEYIDELKVHAALSADPGDYLSFLESNLVDIAAGRSVIEMPPKKIFSDPVGQGDFRVMPCVVRNSRSIVKTVKVVGTNMTQIRVPDQVTVGKAFHIHPEENFITHIFEACLLSSARTGVCAALAVKHLAPVRRRITIVGAGRVGYYVSLYVSQLEGVEEITIQDLKPGRAEAIAILINDSSNGRIRCRAVAEKDVDETDVFILATTSLEPLVGADDLRAHLVVSVGADTEYQHELKSSLAKVADIYVDTLDSVHVGDLREWIGSGALAEEDLVDLLRLLREGPRPVSGRARVFISTGSALFDNLTIKYFLNRSETSAHSSKASWA